MIDNINLIYFIIAFMVTLIIMFIFSMYLYSKLINKAQKRYKIAN